MEPYVDLHMHSTRSDGSFSPRGVVQHAASLGIRAISLTDHDTVAGVAEAQEAGAEFGVEVIAGTELSAQVGNKEVHILGYFVDPNNSDLLGCLKQFRDARIDRAEKMVGKLNKMGVPVRLSQVLAKAGNASVGRPHVADVLVEEGFVFSPDEAFHKYLGYSKPAYQPKFALTPAEAIGVIHAAGGLASVAHPVLYAQDSLLPGLIAQGVDGIEVMHVKHNASAVARYSALAEKHGLLKTGGSDCHGDGRGQAVMGCVKVPCDFLDGLKQAWETRQ